MRNAVLAMLVGLVALGVHGCSNDPVVAIDLERALAPRTLGNPDAPVRIEQFSSPASGQSAEFHKNTFPELKSEFIDEGFVHLTYHNHALDGPALDAAILSRCVPEERFFEFIGLLFDTQADWAKESDHRSALRPAARSVGVSDERMDACWADPELRDAMNERYRRASDEHGIGSAPGFVVNGELRITGAKPIGDFRRVINDERGISAERLIWDSVAARNIQDYEGMKKNGANDTQLCLMAGLVVGAYSTGGNETELAKWQEIEKADCGT